MGKCSSVNNNNNCVIRNKTFNQGNQINKINTTQQKEQIIHANTLLENKKKLLESKITIGTKYPKGEKKFHKTITQKITNRNNPAIDNLYQEVELYLSMDDIKNLGNYKIKVSICNNKKLNQFEFIGETEEILGEKIDFGTVFTFNYYFEKVQILKLNIYEENQELIEMEIIVGNIMGSKNFIYSKKIEINDLYYGIIKLGLKQKIKTSLNNQISKFLTRVELYDNKTGEYFLVFKRKSKDAKWRDCYKSCEFFPINGIYTLGQFQIDLSDLCDSKKENILIELHSNELIEGYSQFSIEKLENFKQNEFILTKNLNSSETIGKIIINYTSQSKKTFMDYLKGGLNLNLNIAIDYTSSNGLPNYNNSLHYIYGNEPNDYENAIFSCGNIVGYYDRDQIFPCYGFGGIPKGKQQVSHCFNINFQESPDIYLIDNVIKEYKESFQKITLYGPTFFSPIIKKVMNNLKEILDKSPNENHYEILMILTDGLINDMDETVKLLIDCESLPLSVIIIGIGKADLSNMTYLDGDVEPLTDNNGRVTKRDLVQFVEYEKFKNGFYKNYNTNELSEEVLKEIPRQIEEYYSQFGQFYEIN